ncbi:Prolyl tripeptidyl peptidase precursor [Gemmata obscuriglobus]|uniref:S9 family peptidase n=1 Tax=Gemmata obscuriglobus TaxID=114 RepID=A0A2Z3HCB2_9BACT|nr:alpha/beta fold hydrolase [Gemmata obscuriglobus]AWM42042.1 S9 family peptidase [Gemmata obscuriglobus]QEG31964.1 Prolyl tripeptidyl peptidase precursor [Gemmata obscuriglobus]VTS11314.1 dipeptidyl peptidase iv : Gll3871 protein OS=Gloeobacter violaceus (strain PCC 7421) GN=gll3871 PE=4 SV=1: DPPIV_N: Peptidase_S9 [Gemmata obscuriglobus UQM 2246]
MKLTLSALAAALALGAHARAADPTPRKPVDTSFLKRFAETRRFMLGRPQNPKVAPDGKTVLFLRADADKPALKLFEFDVATGQTKELLSPQALLGSGDENLTPEEKARRERMRLTAGGFADFHFDAAGNNILLPLSGRLFVYDRATRKVTELKTGAGGAVVDPKWSPDGKKVAYVRGFDVYVIDLATNTETAITTGGTVQKTHGLAEFVAQEEMGRFTGYWWSPDSKYIAYEEADHAGVETWFVADPFKPNAKPLEQFYPRPGKKNVAVRLGVVPVAGGETVWMEMHRYEYLARVDWGKAGLVYQLQSRNQKEWGLQRYDPDTGKTYGVCHDLGAPELPWQELVPLLPRSTEFNGNSVVLYGSDQCDRNTLPKLPGAGNHILNMTEHLPDGRFRHYTLTRFNQFLSLDSANKHAYIVDSADPTQAHVCRVGIDRDRTFEHLTSAPGQHTAVFSKNHAIGVFTSTTLTRMPTSTVRIADPSGAKLGELPSVAVEPDLKLNVTIAKLGDFWTAVVRPHDFDPKKKYPVILDVYGGPRHLHVVQAMRNWLVPQWLANQGFVVVAVDNRGTPGRGREWERAVYQKFGTVPLDDQVKGLRLLCEKHPELDGDRVGIVGWSFGGYMAANGVLRRPDVFKAAVAGAPVTDWEDYDTHYTERYMGLLPEAQKAYDEASLLPLAKGLTRPLLLVHGTADDNVYYRHSLKLSDALFRAGKNFDSLPLPGVTHMYTSDPVVTERLWGRAAVFFATHLGAPK